jgi:hypothetical protein
MPWRLILFIAIFAVFLGFVTLNLDNRCNINIGFAQFEGVPIFLTVFITFSLGLLCGAPLALHLRRKRREKLRKDMDQIDDYRPAGPVNPEANEKIKNDAASARKRFFLNRRDGKK